jgi:hypothetical protein
MLAREFLERFLQQLETGVVHLLLHLFGKTGRRSFDCRNPLFYAVEKTMES